MLHFHVARPPARWSLTIRDLPDQVFVPELKIGEFSTSAQFKDSNGVFHIPVFRTQQSGLAWLKNGGWDLWRQCWMDQSKAKALTEKELRIGRPVIEQTDTEQLLRLRANDDPRCFDLEPEHGSLFSPKDRQIAEGSTDKTTLAQNDLRLAKRSAPMSSQPTEKTSMEGWSIATAKRYSISFPQDWLVTQNGDNAITAAPPDRCTYLRGGYTYARIPNVEASIYRLDDLKTQQSPRREFADRISLLKGQLPNFLILSEFDTGLQGGHTAFCAISTWTDAEAELKTLMALTFHGRDCFFIECRARQGVFESSGPVEYAIRSGSILPLKQFTFAHHEKTFRRIVGSLVIR